MGFLPNEEVLQYISKSTAVVTATKLYEGHPRLLSEASALGTLSIYPSFGGMDEFFLIIINLHLSNLIMKILKINLYFLLKRKSKESNIRVLLHTKNN